MTRPIKTTRHRLARQHRHLTKVRAGGGSTIITIPKDILIRLGVSIGDRVLMEFDPISQSISIRRDTPDNIDQAKGTVSNLKIITDRYHDLRHDHDRFDQSYFEQLEKLIHAIVKHLRGEIITDRPIRDDEGL